MMDSDGENIIADPLTAIGQSSEKLTESLATVFYILFSVHPEALVGFQPT
jgi:hypothetical protein